MVEEWPSIGWHSIEGQSLIGSSMNNHTVCKRTVVGEGAVLDAVVETEAQDVVVCFD